MYAIQSFGLKSRTLLLTCITCLIVISASIAQNVIYVNDSALGINNGTSWINAFTNLQDALSAATSGKEIWIADGIYTPSDSDQLVSFELKNNIRVYGGFAGHETKLDQRDWIKYETVLSGDVQQDDVLSPQWNINTPNSDQIIRAIGTGPTTLLDGVTITAGHGSFGGGIYINYGSPVIRNCRFERNVAAFNHGGAVYCLNGNPTFINTTFVGNVVHLGRGGAIYTDGSSGLTVLDCDFLNNKGIGASPQAFGGGICHYGTLPLYVKGCMFDGNNVDNFYSCCSISATFGGGIYNRAENSVIESCTFRNNFAHYGAGIANSGNKLLVANCLFHDNTVESYPLSPVVDHGDFGAAIATGVFAFNKIGITRIINCTMVNNTGGEAVAVSSGGVNQITEMINCIVWGNTSTGFDIEPVKRWIEGNIDVLYSDVESLYDSIPGEDPPDSANSPGSISEDPLFLNAANDDYRLTQGSLCIDAGDNNAFLPFLANVDLLGLPRFYDDPLTTDIGAGSAPLIDMGSFEYQNNTLQLCNAPSLVRTTNITAKSAKLNWTSVFPAIQYQVRGRLVGTIHYVYLDIPANTCYLNVNSLGTGQTFEWQVRAFCDSALNDTSAWSVMDTFSTECKAPGSHTVNYYTLSGTFAELQWARVEGAIGYRIKGREYNTAQSFVSIDVLGGSKTAFTANGLSPSTTYEWKISAGCSAIGGNIVLSAYSPLDTFTTDSYIPKQAFNSEFIEVGELQIFPNPARDYAVIQINNPEEGNYFLRVMDLSGRVVHYEREMQKSFFNFEVRTLPPGIYFIEAIGKNIYRGKLVIE